jgi:hypothetical protein
MPASRSEAGFRTRRALSGRTAPETSPSERPGGTPISTAPPSRTGCPGSSAGCRRCPAWASIAVPVRNWVSPICRIASIPLANMNQAYQRHGQYRRARCGQKHDPHGAFLILRIIRLRARVYLSFDHVAPGGEVARVDVAHLLGGSGRPAGLALFTITAMPSRASPSR